MTEQKQQINFAEYESWCQQTFLSMVLENYGKFSHILTEKNIIIFTRGGYAIVQPAEVKEDSCNNNLFLIWTKNKVEQFFPTPGMCLVLYSNIFDSKILVGHYTDVSMVDDEKETFTMVYKIYGSEEDIRKPD